MKAVHSMTMPELIAESLRLNSKIAVDSRQPWHERKLACYKINAPTRMKKGYFDALKLLYGETQKD